ncbi:N-6 DNA methylase, partial [mine drainage metagenome]
ERDMVDAIIALPTDLFYNTGIATYIWLVTNRKDAEDSGKVRLIDATARWAPMRKSLGSKRRELTDADISAVVNLYLDHERDATVKVFAPSDFGFRKVFIERPLRLDVDLRESEPGRFRNASAVDEYCLWMQQQFGTDVADQLKDVTDDVTAHVEDEEGLSLLRATEGAAKADLAAAEKACRRIQSSLLDAEMWAERRALTGLLRSLRTAGKQTEWMDYNVFLEALERHAKAH